MVSPLDAIDTFVIVILENQSFDHMLGYLNLPGPRRLASEGVPVAAGPYVHAPAARRQIRRRILFAGGR